MASFVRPAAIPIFVPLTCNGGRTQTGLGWLRGLGQAGDPCAVSADLVASPACLQKMRVQQMALPCFQQLVQAGCYTSAGDPGPGFRDPIVAGRCLRMNDLCQPDNPSGQLIYPGTPQQTPAPTSAPASDMLPILLSGGALLAMMMMMSD
jgi:hypothetical protein